jgi:hypothetical protein
MRYLQVASYLAFAMSRPAWRLVHPLVLSLERRGRQ